MHNFIIFVYYLFESLFHFVIVIIWLVLCLVVSSSSSSLPSLCFRCWCVVSFFHFSSFASHPLKIYEIIIYVRFYVHFSPSSSTSSSSSSFVLFETFFFFSSLILMFFHLAPLISIYLFDGMAQFAIIHFEEDALNCT